VYGRFHGEVALVKPGYLDREEGRFGLAHRYASGDESHPDIVKLPDTDGAGA
jgi:hypothetical protein